MNEMITIELPVWMFLILCLLFVASMVLSLITSKVDREIAKMRCDLIIKGTDDD